MAYQTLENVLQQHLADPEDAAEFIASAMEDGTPTDVANAINAVLRVHGINGSTLEEGSIEKLISLLASIDMRLQIAPVTKKARRPSTRVTPAVANRARKIAA